MPLLQGTKRISPLDINKNVSIGVTLPLDEVNMFKGTKTLKEQIKTNLINVLLTEPGERVNEPDFGVGLKKLLFEPNINTDDVNERINLQIDIYIPEISLIDTQVNFVDKEHLLYITITYSFNLDNSKDSIQLNFR